MRGPKVYRVNLLRKYIICMVYEKNKIYFKEKKAKNENFKF